MKMFENLLNFDFYNCSDEERRNWLLQVFPIMKMSLKVAKRQCARKQLSCESCQIKAECDQYNKGEEDIRCLILEPLISGRHEGTGYREKNAGFLIKEFKYQDSDNLEDTNQTGNTAKVGRSELKSIRKIRSDEQLMLYKNCNHSFTEQQWDVVYLKLAGGLKYREIGDLLGISTSAASDRFSRAKRDMVKSYRERREKNSNKKADT
ncbi:hypothetical protein ACFL3G_02630 [Planctomycetota bacterium]